MERRRVCLRGKYVVALTLLFLQGVAGSAWLARSLAIMVGSRLLEAVGAQQCFQSVNMAELFTVKNTELENLCQCFGATCGGTETTLPLNATQAAEVIEQNIARYGVNAVSKLAFDGEVQGFKAGPLPDMLCDFEGLQVLECFACSLTGTIPSCLGNMPNLTHVDLRQNELTGTAPESFNELDFFWWDETPTNGGEKCALDYTSAHVMADFLDRFLGPSAMYDELEICNCTPVVSCTNTSVNTTLFPDVDPFRTAITSLQLTSGDISGTIPASICRLTDLRELNLAYSFVTGTIPDCIGNLSQLGTFRFQQNSLSGTIPDSFMSLSHLAQLEVAGCQLSGTLPAGLAALPLQVTFMGQNSFSGTIPVEWGLPGAFPAAYWPPTLESNQLSGTVPPGIFERYSLILLLADNQLTGTLPSFVNTGRLWLYDNLFTGTMPNMTWANYEDLVNIDVSNNKLTGAMPAELSPKLTVLTVDRNLLTGTLPESLNHKPFLYDLVVGNNELTGPILAFTESSYLRYVGAANNQLTGTIPQGLVTKERLQLLDVSLNALEGSVPDAGAVEDLAIYIIADNQLTGTLTLPGSGSLQSFIAGGNLWDNVDTGTWCKAGENFFCDLDNVLNPNMPCRVECGDSTLDLTALCDLECSCPAMDSEFANFAAESLTDNVVKSSCNLTFATGACEYACEEGFTNAGHFATCDNGYWSLPYGCQVDNCPPMTMEDVSWVDVSSCANEVVSGSTCNLECSRGTVLVGNATATCIEGQWVTEAQCIPADRVVDTFVCKSIPDSLLPNVEPGACRNTEGRVGVGFGSYWTVIVDLDRDFLSEPPGECDYTCASGYYPNPDARTVECDLGVWRLYNASCLPRSCDDFWTPWSECSGFCVGGKESRTFEYTDAELDDVRAALGGGVGSCPTSLDDEVERVEQIECRSRPRCCASYEDFENGNCNADEEGLAWGFLTCDSFWGQWSDCTEFCTGGTRERTFDINYPPLPDNAESLGVSRLEFVAAACPEHYAQGTDVQDCKSEHHSACIALFSTLGCVVFLALIVVAGVMCSERRNRIMAQVRHSRLGALLLRDANGSASLAASFMMKLDELVSAFRDLDVRLVYVALRRCVYDARAARNVLSYATTKREEPNRVDVFSMSLEEALELGDWKFGAGRTMDGIAKLLRQEHAHIPSYQTAMTNLAEEDTTPYLHLAVTTRWTRPKHQESVVCAFTEGLREHIIYRHVHLPFAAPRASPVNALQLALSRCCPPGAVEAILRRAPDLAEECDCHEFAAIAKAYPQQAELVGRAAELALGIRLAAQLKEAEAAGEDDFVPPVYRARELKHLLTEFGEKMIDSAYNGADEQVQHEDDWVTHEVNSAAWISRTAVINVGEPQEAEEVSPGRVYQPRRHVRPKETKRHSPRRKRMRQRSSSGGISRHSSSGSSTRSRSPSHGSVHRSRSASEEYLESKARPTRAGSGGGELDDLSDETTSHDSFVDEEAPALTMAQKKAYRETRAFLGAVSTGWTNPMQTGFLRPALCVVKHFLEAEIQSAGEHMDELGRLAVSLSNGFLAIYSSICQKFVDSDPELPRFQQVATRVYQQTPEAGGYPVLQPYRKILQLYLAHSHAKQTFNDFVRDIAIKTDALPGSGVTPLKTLFRVMEKVGFRDDGQQWNADKLLDIVRGSLIYKNMASFINCLEVLERDERVKIMRIKDRFSKPTIGGWRDCLLNVRVRGINVVCELQLVHEKLRLARREMAGHGDYVIARAALELQAAYRASQRYPKHVGVDLGGIEGHGVRNGAQATGGDESGGGPSGVGKAQDGDKELKASGGVELEDLELDVLGASKLAPRRIHTT